MVKMTCGCEDVVGRACGYKDMWLGRHVVGRACGWEGMWLSGHEGGRACGWKGIWLIIANCHKGSFCTFHRPLADIT